MSLNEDVLFAISEFVLHFSPSLNPDTVWKSCVSVMEPMEVSTEEHDVLLCMKCIGRLFQNVLLYQLI